MATDLIFALENAGWPAFVVDASSVVRRANAAAIAVFGAALEGRSSSLSSIWADSSLAPDAFLARWQNSPSPVRLTRLRVKDGSIQEFALSICSFEHNGERHYIFQTPTIEKGQADKEAVPAAGVDANVAQKQKLDCALKLARTVALDFNNALTSILGHASLILSKMERAHPWRNSLVEVEKSAEKAAEIAHDLAAFSLQEKDSRTQVAGNLNDLLRRLVETFKGTSGHILWLADLESKLYSAAFDEAKLQQALVKVFENAVQAVGPEGRVRVRTVNRDVPEPIMDGAAQIAPGNYVCIEVIDNGVGIPPEVLPRVFEPFFTTRGSGHRGLGLAWVYGIVTNHGGTVAISSLAENGTTVRLYLPATQKIIRDQHIQMDDLSGTETILMIDDEDLLLTMGEAVLSSYGYQVLTANSGAKGLEIFSRAPQSVDLVITDMVMPRMGGREVIEHLRKIVPGVKIICSSGYLRASGSDIEEEAYLQKPFSSQDLVRKVKQILAGSGAIS